MNKWILPLVLLTAFLPSMSQADPYLVYGYGTQSCGWWIEERKNDSSQASNAEGWITGFISGYQYSGYALPNTDLSAMSAFVDNWCQENPLEGIGTAAGHLVDALYNKK